MKIFTNYIIIIYLTSLNINKYLLPTIIDFIIIYKLKNNIIFITYYNNAFFLI